jgi:hypothetical protein
MESDVDERDLTGEWLRHPVVQRAAEAAGGTHDPLLLLEKMVEVMNELEDKFPGVPFDKILNPTTPASKNRVYAHLVNECGLTEEEATAATSGFTGDTVGEVSNGRRLNRAELFAKVHAGAPLEDFERADRRHVQVLRRQPTEADIEVGRLIAMGANQEESGRSKNTYHAAKLRMEYAEWQRVTRA